MSFAVGQAASDRFDCHARAVHDVQALVAFERKTSECIFAGLSRGRFDGELLIGPGTFRTGGQALDRFAWRTPNRSLDRNFPLKFLAGIPGDNIRLLMNHRRPLWPLSVSSFLSNLCQILLVSFRDGLSRPFDGHSSVISKFFDQPSHFASSGMSKALLTKRLVYRRLSPYPILALQSSPEIRKCRSKINETFAS